MTQEEKDLVVKDLCARLPYGVKCRISDDKEFHQDKTIDEELTLSGYKAFVDTMNCFAVNPFFVKPYLRPMSSMTEEEKRQTRDLWIDADVKTHATRLIDFYNSHHLDYRGLIPMGLAFEAPKDMY